MIVQKELANNPFGHGDLHALRGVGTATAGTALAAPLFSITKKKKKKTEKKWGGGEPKKSGEKKSIYSLTFCHETV